MAYPVRQFEESLLFEEKVYTLEDAMTQMHAYIATIHSKVASKRERNEARAAMNELQRCLLLVVEPPSKQTQVC
jgi:hypothetical protein